MFEFQTQLIFPTHAVPKAGALPRGAQRLAVRTADGEVLAGVHFAPRGRAASKTLVLGFGGNAWNGQDVAAYLHELYPDVDVAAFHYRGYAPSTGSPSAEALIADAPLVYDHLIETLRPETTIAVGFSIGSGVAARLATHRPLDGVILVTPFDSLKAAAQSLYPWVPIGPFFRHEIDAASALAGADVPVAILAGEKDTLIQPSRTDALRKRVRNLVFDRTIKGAGHNDIYTRSEFQAAMDEALDKVSG